MEQTKNTEQTANTEPRKNQVIGPVRLSYLTVFSPRENPNREPGNSEYSVVMLIPKEANEFCPDPISVGKVLSGFIKSALEEKFPTLPTKWDNPLKDGDTELDRNGNPRYSGYWYCRTWCKSEYPPMLVNCDKDPVTEGWDSGDWGKVLVNCYAYDSRGSLGVGVGLRAIQFLRHDEPLGGSSISADAFEVESGESSRIETSNTNPHEFDPFA